MEKVKDAAKAEVVVKDEAKATKAKENTNQTKAKEQARAKAKKAKVMEHQTPLGVLRSARGARPQEASLHLEL